MAVKTAIFKGPLYLRPASGGALLSTGNSTKIQLAQEIEELTVPNMQNPGGGNHDAFKRVKSVKLAISFRDMTKQVAEIVFGASIAAVTAGPVTDEPHDDIVLGSLIPLLKPQDTSAVMTVEKAGTPLTVGVDYKRVRAGIIPLTGGSLIAGDDVTITYTALAASRIEGLMMTSKEFYGLLDAINERTGQPAIGDFWRLAFGPAKSIDLASEGFVSFDCEAELLSDDSRPVNESPFYRFLVGGLD